MSLPVRHLLTLALLPAGLAMLLPPTPAASQTSPVEGSWRGVLSMFTGIELRIVFHIERDEAGLLSATMDSPDQGATAIPVQQATFEEGRLDLQMPQIQGRYQGTLMAPDTLDGEWTQVGQSFPLVLTRTEGDEGPGGPPDPPRDRRPSFRRPGGGGVGRGLRRRPWKRSPPGYWSEPGRDDGKVGHDLLRRGGVGTLRLSPPFQRPNERPTFTPRCRESS